MNFDWTKNYAWGNNVLRPHNIRFEHVVRCLPLGTCKTCRNPTNGYSKEYDTICERCAIGYTNAFYKISYEQFGIKVKGVKYVEKKK